MRLSELFAQLLADGRQSALAEILETGRRDCPHLERQLEALVLEIELKVNELADILSLALPDGLEYRDVLAEAHRQMARVATSAAEDLLRSQVPESQDIEEDWPFDDLDSLTDALTNVCAAPLELEPAAKPQEWDEPGDAESDLQPPTGSGPIVVQPASVATLATPPRTRPATCMAAPNLLDRLTGVVAICRPARRPLSLMLVKFSAGEDLLSTCAKQEIATMRQVLGKVCGKVDHPGTICLPHTEFGYALILPGAERQQAIELGNDLMRTVHTLATAAGVEQKDGLKLDVGVATVAQLPKNFPPRDLLAAADRCLYASHASGGGVVKSIEIY